jgi:spermine oxidase
VGGRVISILMNPATRIELGANWIHGVLGNPLFELAMQYNLIDIMQTTPQNRKVIALIENGKQVPFDVLQEIYEAYLIFLKRCEEYFLCQYAPPDEVSEHSLKYIRIELRTVHIFFFVKGLLSWSTHKT